MSSSENTPLKRGDKVLVLDHPKLREKWGSLGRAEKAIGKIAIITSDAEEPIFLNSNEYGINFPRAWLLKMPDDTPLGKYEGDLSQVEESVNFKFY